MSRRRTLLWRWGLPALALTGLLGYISAGLGARPDPAAPGPGGAVAGLTSVLERSGGTQETTFRLEDVTRERGLTFTHFPDARHSLLPEDMGSGAAWGDYDDDGDPDLFLVNFKGSIRGDGGDPAAGACRLYRNDDGFFVDVSGEAGVDLVLYGMGATWADYDNDNDLDLYVTAYGPNVLMRNEGDGTFRDVSAAAGVNDPAFSAGAAWADYDRDGHPDLYVCNYVQFRDRPGTTRPALRQYGTEIPYTLNPSAYPPAANRLYRNNGDGTFEDRAQTAGVANPSGRSLQAVWLDLDLDSWPDLYVANDVSANGVYRNTGDGRFADIGASSLAADYRGAMGLAAGDHDRDGDLDLFVTHWVAQENALFTNMWSGGLRDRDGRRRLFLMDSAEQAGLGQISLQVVGWASGFADLDADGLADLWVVNGSTMEQAADPGRLNPMPGHLYRQHDEGGFFEVAAGAAPSMAAPQVGRGGAAADFDGDGLLDLVVLRHGDAPLLLRNTTPSPGHWIRFDLRQRGANTRALGARIEISAGQHRQMAQVEAGGSYLSQNDLPVTFGLGAAAGVDEAVITWPDGARERHGGLEAGRTHRLTRASPE